VMLEAKRMSVMVEALRPVAALVRRAKLRNFVEAHRTL
jgi:hypothetical protein